MAPVVVNSAHYALVVVDYFRQLGTGLFHLVEGIHVAHQIVQVLLPERSSQEEDLFVFVVWPAEELFFSS